MTAARPVGAADRSSRASRDEVAVAAAGFAAMAATVAAGLYLARDRGQELGLPYPPLVGRWDPAATWWALAVAAVLAAGAWAGPRLVRMGSPLAFAALVYALTLAARLALGAASRGPDEWWRVFDPDSFEGANEYPAALGALRYGGGFFLDRFAELVPALPVHAAGHPPGLLLLMHWLNITSAQSLAALCLLGGAAIAPLVYATGRTVTDERTARCAALLTALSPSVLLFGATSADALFAVLGLLAAWPLASGRPAARAAGALALAVGSLFAWSLLAVGGWAALLAWRRHGLRNAARLVLLCGGVLLAVHALLAATTGFDPIGTLRATERVYRFGIAGERPYAFWLPGSPTAFLLMLGLPTAWLALRALAAGEPAAVAIFGVIAAAAVGGFTKAEVERIWMFLAPLACIAAATRLEPHSVRPVLALLGVQALVWELAWNTVW
jgi:methylthioxylose transferase